jgi:hypothetical protein
MTHIEHCTLRIDLPFLIQHCLQLRIFLSRIARVSDVRILVYDEHKLLQGDTSNVAQVISLFLGSLSGRRCQDFAIDRKVSWPQQPPFIPSYPDFSAQRDIQEHLSTFASTVENVELQVDMFSTPHLSNLALAFARSPSITRLNFHASARSSEPEFLRALLNFHLPALEEISLTGSMAMSHVAKFLDRHPTIRQLRLATATLNLPPVDWEIDYRYSLANVTHLTLCANYVPSFFQSFDVGYLSSLTIITAFYSLNSLTMLSNALDIVFSHAGRSISQLKVMFSMSLDFSLRHEPYDNITPDVCFPKRKAMGISQLGIDFRDALECEASMVSLPAFAYGLI